MKLILICAVLGFFILSSQPAQLENKKLRAEDFDAEEGEPLEEEDELFDQGRIKHLKREESPFVYLTSIKPAINDENADVRQAAVYGIGICAGLGGSGSVFKPLVGGSLVITRVVALLGVVALICCQCGGHVMVLSRKRLRPVQVPTASASNVVIVSWGCCCLCSASECCVLNFHSSEWFSICG
ncbi:hypothetical protein NC651_039759 [Populus alba x Populus x berolinensis]|nr:hypothetical protein NC651_039759 [Populus alba x Populus x berolinensis]